VGLVDLGHRGWPHSGDPADRVAHEVRKRSTSRACVRKNMSQQNEHDDDRESEVTEGAAIETEQYEEADDEEIASRANVTNPSKPPPANSDQADDGQEQPEDEAADTI
jgi:hypothetical protein